MRQDTFALMIGLIVGFLLGFLFGVIYVVNTTNAEDYFYNDTPSLENETKLLNNCIDQKNGSNMTKTMIEQCREIYGGMQIDNGAPVFSLLPKAYGDDNEDEVGLCIRGYKTHCQPTLEELLLERAREWNINKAMNETRELAERFDK